MSTDEFCFFFISVYMYMSFSLTDYKSGVLAIHGEKGRCNFVLSNLLAVLESAALRSHIIFRYRMILWQVFQIAFLAASVWRESWENGL